MQCCARFALTDPRTMPRRAFLLLLLGAIGLATIVYANWPAAGLPEDTTADAVLVEKSARRLTLLRDQQPLKTYRISLGRQPIGPKVQEGDRRTPEGAYILDDRNPASGYHRALHVSYPDADDVSRARELGVSPGGDIMIHGIRNRFGWLGRLHRLADWTQGCIAVTNPEIREIWRAVPDGTPITILP
jgi:murein L,D-transpeptidase YafK